MSLNLVKHLVILFMTTRGGPLGLCPSCPGWPAHPPEGGGPASAGLAEARYGWASSYMEEEENVSNTEPRTIQTSFMKTLNALLRLS